MPLSTAILNVLYISALVPDVRNASPLARSLLCNTCNGRSVVEGKKYAHEPSSNPFFSCRSYPGLRRVRFIPSTGGGSKPPERFGKAGTGSGRESAGNHPAAIGERRAGRLAADRVTLRQSGAPGRGCYLRRPGPSGCYNVYTCG